ncbi:MAG: hypothetical protein LBI27_07370 [Clostridiales bacterium]|nr:hypothetical protein [Clostridiales bacterium]
MDNCRDKLNARVKSVNHRAGWVELPDNDARHFFSPFGENAADKTFAASSTVKMRVGMPGFTAFKRVISREICGVSSPMFFKNSP